MSLGRMGSNSGSDIVEVMQKAVMTATEYSHTHVTFEHILYALLSQREIVKFFESKGHKVERLSNAMIECFERQPGQPGFIPTGRTQPQPTRSVEKVFAAVQSKAQRGVQISCSDILLAMLEFPAEDSVALQCLMGLGIDSMMLKEFMNREEPEMAGGAERDPNATKEISSKKDALEFLSKYCVNLNELAKAGKLDPMIGRQDELDALIQTAARRTKNNTIITAEPGVGKTAIVEGLAQKIVDGAVPEVLLDAVVYSLDVAGLMAGTRYRGDMEERVKFVVKALKILQDDEKEPVQPILFIDEIHMLMGGSGSDSMSMANILKPSLARGELKAIGATTLEEFRKHFEKDRALMRRFKRLSVDEPDVKMAKEILQGLKKNYEEFHGVTYTDEAIEAAVDLTSRYITNALLPDKAIDILDQAGARQRVASPIARVDKIDVGQIEYEVAKTSKIPLKNISNSEASKLDQLEDDLQSAVFGQNEAIGEVVSSLFVSRSGLRHPNKPMGVFLFAGPTGTGKTEVARQIENTLGLKLIRYDMSEYMESHSVAKLIGSPPGYVGYGDGGQGSGKLINDVDAHPHCVLLLDEIEKAHPDVYNILLQVFEEGKLTSSSGKPVDFRNVLVIMTTNAGAMENQKNALGFGGMDGGDPDVAIKKLFTPEFRNRLDAIVHFKPLSKDSILRIVDKFVNQLREMSAERNVTIKLEDGVREWIAEKGFDKQMGARPMDRVIHNHIKKPLSRLMVSGCLALRGGEAKIRLNEAKTDLIVDGVEPKKVNKLPELEAAE